MTLEAYAEWHNIVHCADCLYAKCRYAECRGAVSVGKVYRLLIHSVKKIGEWDKRTSL